MYWKIIEDGVIKCIGISNPVEGIEITDTEYAQILAVIQSCPHEPGYVYELLENLTWRVTQIGEVDESDE